MSEENFFCDDCKDQSSCPVIAKHGKVTSCPFIINNQKVDELLDMIKENDWELVE